MLNNEEIPMFGDGTTSRDYTYIDDIVDGIIKSCNYVLENKNVYEILNIGNSSQSQKFKFEHVKTIDDGTYTIKTAIDENYVLDIGGASVEDGGNVQLWNNCSVAQQKFKVKYLGNGFLKLK